MELIAEFIVELVVAVVWTGVIGICLFFKDMADEDHEGK